MVVSHLVRLGRRGDAGSAMVATRVACAVDASATGLLGSPPTLRYGWALVIPG